MKISPIKTHKITVEDSDILAVIDKYVTTIEESSVLVVTSKIVALCEGNVVPTDSILKDDLVKSQADKYLPKETNTFNIWVTIKDNVLAVNAGVDESNSQDGYVLWPKNSQQSANKIREHLAQKFDLKNFGVLITDSKTTPLRYGITGIGLAHSGFKAINDHVGQPDIFGRLMKMTKVNVMDGLSAAAAVVMGESSEQTPLSIITDIPFVQFQQNNPTQEDLQQLDINPELDVYGELIRNAPWEKGKMLDK